MEPQREPSLCRLGWVEISLHRFCEFQILRHCLLKVDTVPRAFDNEDLLTLNVVFVNLKVIIKLAVVPSAAWDF